VENYHGHDTGRARKKPIQQTILIPGLRTAKKLWLNYVTKTSIQLQASQARKDMPHKRRKAEDEDKTEEEKKT